MNVERWAAKRRPLWQNLEDLLKQVDRRGLPSLSRDQLQALGRLYRSASADLSRARALNLGADIVGYLNNLVVKAHNQVYQRPTNRWLDLVNFFWATFPALVRRHIGWIALSTAIFVIPALACYGFEMQDVNFGHMEMKPGHPMVSEEMWNMIEQHHMWTDQLQDASPAFASQIATNNIQVCVLSFALSITGAVGTVFVLFLNGMMVGTIVGVCQHYGMADKILGFMVGHGSLELPAIFISGGAGLLLGSKFFFPGQYGRSDAFRLAARPAMGLFAGCVPLLLIAGCIESFISPRTDLPGSAKIVVGLGAFICLIFYLFVPRDPLGKKKPASAEDNTPQAGSTAIAPAPTKA